MSGNEVQHLPRHSTKLNHESRLGLACGIHPFLLCVGIYQLLASGVYIDCCVGQIYTSYYSIGVRGASRFAKGSNCTREDRRKFDVRYPFDRYPTFPKIVQILCSFCLATLGNNQALFEQRS